MCRTLSIHLGAAALATALALGPGLASASPDAPVTIIVPWAPGGATDTVARIFAEAYAKELGVKVDIVNEPGGGGLPADAEIAKAKPDGHTLGVITPEIVYYRKLGRGDVSLDDLDLFSRLALMPAGVTVSASSRYQDIDALLTAVREEPPGSLTSSGAGEASAWHIASAGMLKAASIDPKRLGWVASDGGAPALQKLIAGEVSMVTSAAEEAIDLSKAGKVKVLAVMSADRSPLFPDAPTLRQKGIDWTYANFFALVAPKGIEPARRQALYEAAARTMASPEVQKKLEARGIEPVWDTPEAFKAYLADYEKKVGEVLSALDLSP